MKRLVGAAVSAAAVLAAATGCSSGSPEEWADSVCSSVSADIGNFKSMGSEMQSAAAEGPSALATLLGKLSGAFGNIATAIEDAGEPPVDGGADAAQKVVKTLNDGKAAVDGAVQKLEALPDDAPQQEMLPALQDLQKLGSMGQPMSEFDQIPELKEAFNNTESCKALS